MGMHYVDEPTYYVDEPTYGEEKHSDMDYKIDEPMHYVDEPTYYVDEPTHGEKKHSDDMSFLKTTEKEAAKAEEAKEVAEDIQFEKKPVEKTRSEGKPNLRTIAEKKKAAKALARKEAIKAKKSGEDEGCYRTKETNARKKGSQRSR